MAVNQEVVITFNADTQNVEKSIGKVEQGVEKTSQATAGLTNQLDKMTGGAVSGFKNFSSGLKSGIAGLKSFRVALAATGIGLLITAIAGLVSYFKDTEEGAQRLRVITATLGTVMEKLRDVLINVGEAIFNAFSNPKQALLDFASALRENITNRFEGMLEIVPKLGEAIQLLFEGRFGEAGKVAADAVGKVALGVESVTEVVEDATKATADYVKEIQAAATAAAELARQENALKVAEREFLSVRAETNKLIAENRLLVEDEKLAYEDRIAALDNAIQAEQETIAQELEFARERARILERKAELAKSDEATIQAVAEAQAAVIDLETRSLRTQKRLEGERQSLILQREARAKQEQEAARKAAEEAQKAAEDELAARQKLEDELYALTLSAREKEELALMQKYDERVAIAGDDEGLLRAATEQLNADLAAIEEKYRAESNAKSDAQRQADLDKELANAEAIKQARLDITKSTLDALSALNEAFTGESEQQQKKGFERSKKIQTAQALISTYESAVQAFKSLAGIPVVGPGLGTAAAIAATAAGLANVKKIQSQTFQGGGGGGGSSYSGTGGAASAATAAGQTPPAPTLDLGFLGEGAQQQVIETYVISENVTSAQQANKKIQDQSTL
jgi:hypothetical protein